MRLSFKYKFILSFVIFEILFISLIVFLNFSSLNNLSNSLVRTNIESSSKLFNELIKTPLIINDLATIDNAVESFTKIDYIAAVRIVNNSNIAISHIHDENPMYKDILDKIDRLLNGIDIERVLNIRITSQLAQMVRSVRKLIIAREGIIHNDMVAEFIEDLMLERFGEFKKRYKWILKVKNLRYIADSNIIFPVSRFTEVVYEICKCK